MNRVSKNKYKWVLLFSLIFLVISFFLIKHYYAKKINISVGRSEEFTVSEVREAIDQTIFYFKESESESTITDISYDEKASNEVLVTDTQYEKEFNSKPRNVMVLYINIYSSVPFLESPTSLTNREDMRVYLVRKDKTSDWKVVNHGFG